MKNMMTNLMPLVLAISTLVACAPEKAKQETENNSESFTAMTTDESVTLTSRYDEGDYLTATYSFRHLNQGNVELTKNNWELLFEARADIEDSFKVNTVVDDNSFIYDLGEKSCADIKSSYPNERKKRPMTWLSYSDADPSELQPARSAKVQVGHCYLIYNNDRNGRVIALFHVQTHEKSKSVTIDQIEVLDVLTRK